MGKIMKAGALVKELAPLRKKGKRIVFTNGCFDIIHPGHLELLRKSKNAGDILVVAINTDLSVRRLKGEKRPYFSQRARAEILAALTYVDYVTYFGEDTPREIIVKLLPDVLIKGEDYRVSEIVGAKEVLAAGGRVKRVKLKKGYSTTKILNRMGENRR
ncbi:MAG: hypothetical protein A2X49_16835 [Lentisphaerae bacterium GWF2_52_8]|nr:MAG: hypothetical protein A2X49_16835 [Lentisphaerae bacterium GWF2_52_8]